MYAKKPTRSYETNPLLIFVIIFISIFSMIHPLSAAETILIRSLCATDEKSLFSCKLKNSSKSVSLCQSENDPKEISYKFGAPNKIEISLPNEKSGKPYLSYLSGGRVGAHSIVFPSGKVKHALVFMWELDEKKTIFLSIEEIKKPLNIPCGSGDSMEIFMNALDKMEKLNFKIEEVTP
jgi:hypothetical protein